MRAFEDLFGCVLSDLAEARPQISVLVLEFSNPELEFDHSPLARINVTAKLVALIQSLKQLTLQLRAVYEATPDLLPAIRLRGLKRCPDPFRDRPLNEAHGRNCGQSPEQDVRERPTFVFPRADPVGQE
ncbi:MAG: hypothetical protein ACRD1X_16230 [Vicinamibacteria bacterium]